jgi:hypothetical protein
MNIQPYGWFKCNACYALHTTKKRRDKCKCTATWGKKKKK